MSLRRLGVDNLPSASVARCRQGGTLNRHSDQPLVVGLVVTFFDETTLAK